MNMMSTSQRTSMLAIRSLLRSSIGLTAREREAAVILEFDPEAQLAPTVAAIGIDALQPVPAVAFSLPTWVKLARSAMDSNAEADDAGRLHDFLVSRIVRSSDDRHWHEAVRFVETLILSTRDCPDVQHTLANHPAHRPWLRRSGDPLVHAQAIVREAEGNPGDRVLY
jgi:hypothetical protein